MTVKIDNKYRIGQRVTVQYRNKPVTGRATRFSAVVDTAFEYAEIRYMVESPRFRHGYSWFHEAEIKPTGLSLLEQELTV